MKKFFDFIKKYKYILLLISFAFLSHLQWFNPFSILNSSDWTYWPNEAVRQLYNSYGVWVNFFNFGSVNIQLPLNLLTSIWSLFANLGLSYDFATKITFLIPIAVLGFISPYILFRKLTKNNFIAFIVALFYGATTHFLIRQTAHMPVAFVYALTPLLFYFFIRALEINELKNWLIFILFYWVGICYEIRITYIVTFIIFLYFLFFQISNIKKYWKNILISVSIFFILNIFWLLPTMLGGFSGDISTVANRGLFGSFLFDLKNAFTLSESAWTGSLPNNLFIKQSVIWYLWLIPIIAFSSFLFKKNNKYKKEIMFFGVISLVGIFLTKQTAEPLTSIYLWLYNNFPGFNLFREASKFYLITAIGYMGLLGYGLFSLKEIKNKIWSKLVFIVFSLTIIIIAILNLKPLIMGEMGTMFVSRSIPNDYLVLKDFILKQPEYFRTFWTPNDSRWSIFIEQKPKISNVGVIGADWKNLVKNYNENIKLTQDKIINVFKLPFANNLINISAVKYVIIPLQDDKNDNDFFSYYGGDKDANIRKWYIEELDKIIWLKRIDIGTRDLVVYENENYKSLFFPVSKLFSFNSIQNLNIKFDFVNKQLNNDFYFTVNDSNLNINEKSLASILDPFEMIKQENIGSNNDNTLTTTLNIDYLQNNNSIYLSKNNLSLYLRYYKDNIESFVANDGNLNLNSSIISDSKITILNKVFLEKSNKKYYIIFNSSLEPLIMDKTIKLGELSKLNKPSIFSISTNSVKNPSFEDGLWQDNVGDCNNYDSDGILAMNLSGEEKTDGKQSLQLEATKHTACTSQNFKVLPGEYVFSFDYQSPNSKQAGYFLQFNDINKTVIKNVLTSNDNTWHNYFKKITVPAGADSASLFLYAYSSTGQINNIVHYDNINFSKLKLEKIIEIPKIEAGFEKNKLMVKDGINTINYVNNDYNYQNIFDNGSFEDGLWADNVGDCNNYDNDGILAMKLSGEEKTDGEKSLQLEATKHIACTSKSMSVRGGAYLFSFNYQSDNAKKAGYYIIFNDEKNTKISEILEIKNKTWNNFEKKIIVPDGGDSLNLYIYSYATDGKKNNIVHYDNFKLIEIPDLAGKYYFVSEPEEKLKNPEKIDFEIINPTRKVVHIKGAITPFFLVMSESYHNGWQLQMNNNKIQGFFGGWWPFIKPDRIGDEYHYKLNDFLNSWYVDTEKLCQNSTICIKNNDGSYDMEMVVEFWPQRWFYSGLIISGMTLLSCVGYLIYDNKKRKNK